VISCLLFACHAVDVPRSLFVRSVELAVSPSNALADAFNSIKAGYYAGPPSSSPRTVTFAPNVTPGTYVEPSSPSTSDGDSPTPTLFPPSDLPAPLPSRRRAPPGKRRSMGYIPRPPNAFMLFRADFVRQKHVPGSIETNHGSLSKIIGESQPTLASFRSLIATRQLLALPPSRRKSQARLE
jgi:hypothetical protein